MSEWLHCCENHTFQQEVHYVGVKSKDQKWSQGFRLNLPIDIGPASNLNKSTESKGLGLDRQLRKVLELSKKIMQKGFVSRATGVEPPKKKEGSQRPSRRRKSSGPHKSSETCTKPTRK